MVTYTHPYKELTVSDTHDHDNTTFVRVPGGKPETPDGPAESAGPHDETFMTKSSGPDRGPSLDAVDFDVTAGFGDEPAPAVDEFFDITEGSAAAAPESEIIDLSAADPVAVAESAPASAASAPAPSAAAATPVPPPAAGGGKLAIIALIVAALVAAGLWFVMR